MTPAASAQGCPPTAAPSDGPGNCEECWNNNVATLIGEKAPQKPGVGGRGGNESLAWPGGLSGPGTHTDSGTEREWRAV